MVEYVEIAVNVPQVEGVFHYHLPEEFTGIITTGHLVEVPFGRQQVQGVVLQRVDEPGVQDTKAVSALLDPLPVLTPLQIELAQSIAESTISSLAAMINMMLPSGLGQQADSLYEVRRGKSASTLKPLTPMQLRLLKLLEERGPLRGRQIDRAMPRDQLARLCTRVGRARAAVCPAGAGRTQRTPEDRAHRAAAGRPGYRTGKDAGGRPGRHGSAGATPGHATVPAG